MFSKFCSNRAVVSQIPRLWHARTICSTPTPIIPKKHRASGLSGSKQLIGCQLLKMTTNNWAKKKTESPQGLHSLSWTENQLVDLNIGFGGMLCLKPNAEERAEETKLIGKDDVWSSANLYAHLQRLQTLNAEPNEAAARAWIDALFFRLSAVVLDRSLVLNLGQIDPHMVESPSFTTFHGIINKPDIGLFIFGPPTPTMERLRSNIPPGLVVIEVKSFDAYLNDQFPEGVGELYAFAKSLGKKTIRGVLTSGDSWMFIILVINARGKGAKYWYSTSIAALSPNCNNEIVVRPPWPDVIVGILAYWMDHGFETIEDNDWFAVEPRRQ